MDRLYGKLHEDNTFILHGNKSLITGQLNKNNTIEGVNYSALMGRGDKLNNKEVSYNEKYISIPIIKKTEDNIYIFNETNVHATGSIGNKKYAIVHTTEQGNTNILKWAFIDCEDLEYTNFDFCTSITFNESFGDFYNLDGDYLLCNDTTIYDDENDIDKWMYITLDNIDDYIYDFKYLFIGSTVLTCYTDINKIIICYNNDEKQVFENITNIHDCIYLKCNSDISTITKIYLKLSKSDKPLCKNQCGGSADILCNTCDGDSFCTKCNGSGLYEGTDCTKCNGKKMCIDCNGRGYIFVDFEINDEIHQENKIGIASINIEARKYPDKGFAVYE
jgi:hypothetical protein